MFSRIPENPSVGQQLWSMTLEFSMNGKLRAWSSLRGKVSSLLLESIVVKSEQIAFTECHAVSSPQTENTGCRLWLPRGLVIRVVCLSELIEQRKTLNGRTKIGLKHEAKVCFPERVTHKYRHNHTPPLRRWERWCQRVQPRRKPWPRKVPSSLTWSYWRMLAVDAWIPVIALQDWQRRDSK